MLHMVIVGTADRRGLISISSMHRPLFWSRGRTVITSLSFTWMTFFEESELEYKYPKAIIEGGLGRRPKIADLRHLQPPSSDP